MATKSGEKRFVFERGDFIHLNFDPQAGHEQAGQRPALVVSELAYNRTGLAWVCPVTSQIKNYPFEVGLPASFKLHGVILSDQIRCVDLKERQAKPLNCKAPPPVLEKVQIRIKLILGLAT